MRSLIFSILLTLTCVAARATGVAPGDTIYIVRADTVYLPAPAADSVTLTRYKQHLERYHKAWQRLIPKGLKLQAYGNMGRVSLGPTWIYGKRHWETSLLFGFIPKHNAAHAEATMTIKQDYVPWSVTARPGLTFQPLTAGLYFNTVLSGKFWTHQPGRYPHGYYQFSTRVRTNLCVGERLRFEIPERRRVFQSAVSVFYEASLCDYYFYHKLHNSSLRFKDIVALSMGIQFEWL